MAYVKPTLVQQYGTITGAGAITLGAATSANFKRLQDAGVSNGDTVDVTIRHISVAGEIENVLGTYSSGAGTLTPSFVAGRSSSPTGSLIAFTAGTNNVVISAELPGPATVVEDTSGDVAVTRRLTAPGTGAVATNVAIGATALNANTTGANNTAVGSTALALNTTGAGNTAYGSAALAANTIGTDNTAVGRSALAANTTGVNNAAVGRSALAANTTGQNNTAVGTSALAANTIGGSNTAVGYLALTANTTGGSNTAVGRSALAANTTGGSNTAIGDSALAANTTGVQNVGIGVSALQVNTIGVNNAALGYSALAANTTGVQNTAVGASAGSSITTGTNLTCLGYDAEPSSATATNEVTLGNSSVATLRCQVALTVLSDERDKTNIRPFDLGLDFVSAIEPIWYTWNMRDGGKVDVDAAGVSAQQLQKVERQFGAEAMQLVYAANPDRLEATPGNLTPAFIKAFHDIKARLDAAGI